jgi:hypothetical protein
MDASLAVVGEDVAKVNEFSDVTSKIKDSMSELDIITANNRFEVSGKVAVYHLERRYVMILRRNHGLGNVSETHRQNYQSIAKV